MPETTELPTPCHLFIVRCESGYFHDEEGGAYLFCKKQRHAQRMTRDDAEYTARSLRLHYKEVEIVPI